MKRLTIIFIALITVSTIIILGCSNKEKGRFYSKKYGFSMILPEGWNRADRVATVAIKPAIALTSPENSSSLSVLVQRVPAQITLKQVEERALQIVKSRGVRNIKKANIKISEVEAVKLTATFNKNGTQYSVGSYVCLYKNKVYQVIFDIDNDYLEKYAQIILISVESFRFEK